jgi:hypothetical protein
MMIERGAPYLSYCGRRYFNMAEQYTVYRGVSLDRKRELWRTLESIKDTVQMGRVIEQLCRQRMIPDVFSVLVKYI